MVDGLLIGRFQPFHLGHLEALRFALSMADRLWVGIGSSNKPIGYENPFTADERKDMILSSIDDKTMQRISIYEIPDVDNHIRWMELIDKIVPQFGLVFTNDSMTARLYSKRPGIRAVGIPFLKRHELSGTRIRDMIRAQQNNWRELVPTGTQKILAKCDAASRLADMIKDATDRSTNQHFDL